MSENSPKISYEQARAELGEVVSKLESGRTPLAEAMQLWERGEELARICQEWLDGAKAKVAAARAQAQDRADQHGSPDQHGGADRQSLQDRPR